MARYESQDIKLTEDGDFELDRNGDLATASENELVKQMVFIPLKTTNPDWFHDSIGADLEDLIGLDNSQATAELGREKIKNSLLKTEFFNEEDIWVEANPVDEMTIAFFLFINSPFSGDPLVYQIELDLGFGPTIRRLQ